MKHLIFFIVLVVASSLSPTTMAKQWKGETKVIHNLSSIPSGWIATRIVHLQYPKKAYLIENVANAPYETRRPALAGTPIPKGWVISGIKNSGTRSLINTNDCKLRDLFVILDSSPYTTDFYITHRHSLGGIKKKNILCIRDAPIGTVVDVLAGLVYPGWSVEKLYPPSRVILKRKTYYK